MNEAAQALARALAEERRAALQADFDALVRVQDEKRALMEQLRDGSIEAEFARELHEVAQQNIALIRHLVACVKGYLGATADPGYTARGEVATSAVNHVRGRL